jgi:CubicO group peptidase (beta-lactamase class C family)
MQRRALLLLAAFAGIAAAQDDIATKIDKILGSKIDKIFERYNKSDSPGAAVAVIRDGKLIYQHGYGIANLEYDIPITPETVFHVASVSKQFTAMALVLLEQDGKLSLDDEVRKYLPELPDYGRRLTIRNLLQHTSGVRDQWQTLGIAGWRLDDVITQQQILRLLFRQRELNFDPGARHVYSNGGYTLAAEIVARASGKPMPDFCEERIFKPLAMSRTHFHIDHQRIVRDRAYSYGPFGGGYQSLPLNYANVGATSLFTTAPDLVKWLDNFRDPKVGGPKAIARLQEQAVLTTGETIPYALGISVGKYRGERVLRHGGGDAGYRSFVAWYPGRALGVAVVSNHSSFNSGGIANQVAAVFLPDDAKPADTPARTYITLEPAALARFAGHYHIAGITLEIDVKDGKLMVAPPGAPAIELKPIAATRFYVEPMQADVEFTPAGASGMTVKLTQPGGSASGDRYVFAAYDPKDEDQYLGAWWSEELETQYTILRKDGKLVATHVHHGDIALRPVEKDRLGASSWFAPDVNFLRDSSGKIVAMTLGGGRVTAIRFVRR